jgi:hypothetical protein
MFHILNIHVSESLQKLLFYLVFTTDTCNFPLTFDISQAATRTCDISPKNSVNDVDSQYQELEEGEIS